MIESIRTELLTPLLRRWVNHPKIGLAATLELVRQRGGTAFKFPCEAEGSVLESIVGRTAADGFIELHAPQTINLPKADQILRQIRNQDIRARRRRPNPDSRSMLALEYNLTTRMIDIINGDIDDEPEARQQGALF